MKLNLGCGKDIKEGWVNVDQHFAPGVNLVMDIRELPLPFADNSIDEVLASHILEHCLHWEDIVFDIHRILKPGGIFEVRVPYMLEPAPYHYRSFWPKTMDFITKGCADWQTTKSLDGKPLFEKLEQHVDRGNLLEWHQRKYLGRHLVPLPVRRRYQIRWRFRK